MPGFTLRPGLRLMSARGRGLRALGEALKAVRRPHRLWRPRRGTGASAQRSEMPPRGCRTDCAERLLSRALRALGALVGAHPWPFLLVPLVVTVALGAGFVFLGKRATTNDREGQFTPYGGPAKRERRFVQKRFRTNDREHFSAQRLTTEGAYATLMAVAAPGDSLLTAQAFAELQKLDAAVRGLQAGGLSFAQLCARSNRTCVSPNPLLSLAQSFPGGIEALLPRLTFPLFQGRVFLAPFLGGVKLRPGDEQARPVEAAKALRLVYYLQEDQPQQRKKSNRWVETFLERIPDLLASLNLASIRVAYFSSQSRQQEYDEVMKTLVPLFIAAYILIITYSVVSCLRLDCVRTKVWVAVFGVLSSGLSVLSSFGLLFYCGVPFVVTAANAPFIILGVGIDDMFILVSCWQRTKVKDTVENRMADTYAEAAVSVTITTLTDVLAFYIGTASAFPAITSFCIYTGTAFIFCYLYNLTFLGAILALNGKREESNRHWLTFMKVEYEIQHSHGYLYNRCCTGGYFDEVTGAELEHPMNIFFGKYYGPFLMHTWSKVLVVLLYLLYLGGSIYGCTQIEEGIDVRNLVNDYSYVIQYYNWNNEYFYEYGPRVMVVVTKSIHYWDSSVRADLEDCMKSVESSSYVHDTFSVSWLRTYEAAAKGMSLNIDDRDAFIGSLSALFQINAEFQWDISFSATEIYASRFYVQTINVTTAVDERHLLNELRDFAKKCKVPLLVYNPAFIYFDQYLVIVWNTIQNVLIASGAMLFVSLLFIPNPVCSLWVTFGIASAIVGVTGFMALWKVRLDFVSMICLVICIGFSVDFSAHISYAFVSSEKPEVNDKAVDALYRLGSPIVQGAVSTVVGVLVLSMATTYLFRTFFKIMFMVILFGAAHGLMFIPVFLTFFEVCVRFPKAKVEIQE
ncbi:patched domain-containing protein 3-like [Hemicordylus capensis]|uniref:patched domain-containing protein 3-like n=1 Tax=Hemicordylus capensis TaxID=884348 RepID=UPI002302D71B|nr:patched domain-containing protein 3-like [Hemicordylus capensis]